ncbi:hypothetical protein [Marinomonas flavescens]|uniref:hypothetical protein n=1 Tax=Marinomonas flavescens TaxID=2529379 RepID=UPI001056281E|nr:hypothetical protein [Marinomonas flavescens]
MNPTKLNFPTCEKSQLDELNTLFKQWYASAKNKKFIKEKSSEDLVFDGFYPFFSKQKVKVLFIGRESLGLTGDHYLDMLHWLYKSGENIGKKSLNQSQFHALKLKVSYGLNNGSCPWEEIPSAESISQSFAEENGVSFAFMNLSKLSNDSESWKADWELIDSFTDEFKDEDINFFNKEIEIINPDVIITMNLEGRLANLGELEVLEYGSDVSCFKLTCGSKQILLMDTYHFSAVKKQQDTFYTPIIESFKKYS